jgi:dihydrofolate reductase
MSGVWQAGGSRATGTDAGRGGDEGYGNGSGGRQVAKLTYSVIASLDGYVADANGNFDWAAPTEEVHAFVNDLLRPVGTHLYGRRMYDVMVAWEDLPLEGQSEVIRDWAGMWRAADKVVYSRTLSEVRSARTRIEPEFDPEAVRRMKESAAGDLTVGGPELAGQAIRAGLVDECHLVLAPIVVGGGTPALPSGVRWALELIGERRFVNGTVAVGYRATG